MRGVYLVAAELSRLGLIASPTSRSVIGADVLVTDQSCSRSFSVQVKTNAKTFNFWLVGSKVQEMVSPTHIYVFVNLRAKKDGEVIEFYIVPSSVVAEKTRYNKAKTTGSEWYSFYLENALPFKDKWEVFLGDSASNLTPRSTRTARKRVAG
ncbi:MAG: hypothetical protein KGI30_01860, partial [Planctomycetota bacterium]|nr:hypothetical protein [Planctomycetota bacterium]